MILSFCHSVTLFLKTWISCQCLGAGSTLTSTFASTFSHQEFKQEFSLEQSRTLQGQPSGPSPQSPTCCPLLGAGGPEAAPAQGRPSDGAAVPILSLCLSCSRKHLCEAQPTAPQPSYPGTGTPRAPQSPPGDSQQLPFPGSCWLHPQGAEQVPGVDAQRWDIQSIFPAELAFTNSWPT